MNYRQFLQFPIGARLWIGLALVWMACSRGSGAAPEEPPSDTAPMSSSAAAPKVPETPPATGGEPAPEKPSDEATARSTGTGVLVCDKYIRMVCGCAQKRQNPDLQRACDLAKQSLPEWQKSHKEEGEELAVVKACQRAFLYIQSTGQCDDISY